VNIALVWILR